MDRGAIHKICQFLEFQLLRMKLTTTIKASKTITNSHLNALV